MEIYTNRSTVFPKGLKGYLIDHPDVFHLSEEDRESIYLRSHPSYFIPAENCIPAVICINGNGVIFLSDDDYEIISPFFDMGLADYAYMCTHNEE